MDSDRAAFSHPVNESPAKTETKKHVLDNRSKLIQKRFEQHKQKLMSELEMNERKSETARRAQEAEKARHIEEAREREQRRRGAAAERRRLLDEQKRSRIGGSDAAISAEGAHRLKTPSQRPSSSYAFGSSTPRGLTFLGRLNEDIVVSKPTVKRSIESIEVRCTSASYHKPAPLSTHNSIMSQSMYVPSTVSRTKTAASVRRVRDAEHALTPTNDIRTKTASKKAADDLMSKSIAAVSSKLRRQAPQPSTNSKTVTSAMPTVTSVAKSTRQHASVLANRKRTLKAAEKNMDTMCVSKDVPAVVNESKMEVEPAVIVDQIDSKLIIEESTPVIFETSTNIVSFEHRETAEIEGKQLEITKLEPPAGSFMEPLIKSPSQKLFNVVDSNESAAEAVKTMPKVLTEDEAKTALAERRRLAREQAEKEKELERQKEEALRLAEEQEFMRQEEEELRLIREAKLAEEERLRQALEELRLKKEEEERKSEEEKKKMLANDLKDLKSKELAEKADKEREEKMRRDDLDRIERKKKLESIRRRTRQPLNGDGGGVTLVASMTSSSSGIFTTGDNVIVASSDDASTPAPSVAVDANGNVSDEAAADGSPPPSTTTAQAAFDVGKLLSRVRSKLSNGNGGEPSMTSSSIAGDTMTSSERMNFKRRESTTTVTSADADDFVVAAPSTTSVDYVSNVVTLLATARDDDVANANAIAGDLNDRSALHGFGGAISNATFSKAENTFFDTTICADDLKLAKFSSGQLGEKIVDNDALHNTESSLINL